MKTSSLFERELSYIQNPHLRKIVSNTLDASPEAIQIIPASSSKRFHPAYSVVDGKINDDGTVIEGGLTRHVKAAVGMAHSLVEADIFANMIQDVCELGNQNRLNLMIDSAYAALILHDCCKCDDTPKHTTRFDHPLVAAKLFKETVSKYLIENRNIGAIQMAELKEAVPIIYGAISSHMGKWTTATYAKGIVLPKPKNGVEHFVHLCDYLGSRKFLLFDFDVYAESDR